MPSFAWLPLLVLTLTQPQQDDLKRATQVVVVRRAEPFRLSKRVDRRELTRRGEKGVITVEMPFERYVVDEVLYQAKKPAWGASPKPMAKDDTILVNHSHVNQPLPAQAAEAKPGTPMILILAMYDASDDAFLRNSDVGTSLLPLEKKGEVLELIKRRPDPPR
jgi:hypothetical protein